jgi:hypothetical protein
LKTLFQWLDAHPGSYWIIVSSATLLLIAQLCSSSREERRFQVTRAIVSWRDALVLFLFVFAWRWPFLLAANEYNPDESQLIAGAITLSHDPVFWRSVDGTTSGPLNFYLLVPYAWLGLPLDYFTARLMGLLLAGGALVLVHQTLAWRCGRLVAWLGVLPAATFFSTITFFDLVHYSSEHLTLFLTALAIWLLATRGPSDRFRLWLACCTAGAMVWAKLQAAPLSAALMIWALCQIREGFAAKRGLPWQAWSGAILAGLTPTLIAVVLIAATGQIEMAYRRYIVLNLFYVGDAGSLSTAMKGMAQLAVKDGRLPLLLASALVILIATIVAMVMRRQRPHFLFAVGAGLTFAAIMAILTPRREFLHYALLLPIPLTVWLGAAIDGWWSGLATVRSRATVALLLTLVGLTPVITRAFQPPPEMYGQFAYHWTHPRTSAAVFIRELAGLKGSLAVWGWASNLYVESGLPQATRDAHTIWAIQPNDQRDEHRDVFLEDMRRHEPAVFVDAVGTGAFALENRATQGHEIFPGLADYVRSEYTFVTDLGNARIYARNGLPSLAQMNPSRVGILTARGRLTAQERANTTPVPLTRLDNFQRKRIGQRDVLMLLPPTQVEWLLDDGVRQVSVEFGFDPVAYEQGQSNGANVNLDLVDEKGTRPLFHCFLDPARQADDRPPRTIVITLPPFTAGAHLVLRSDPGPYGDTAWDWVYLANLQFRR